MKTHHPRCSALASLAWVAASLALAACKDDSPCDEGQVARLNSCYPAPAAGAAGQAGSSGEAGAPGDEADTDAGDSGAAAPTQFVIGQPCTDPDTSSDCGGGAPVCAPLPAGPACTQILCQEGEPNAGVCPSDWPCLVFGTNPSACLKL